MTDPRATLRNALNAAPGAFSASLSPEIVFHVAHPVGDLHGPDAVLDGFLRPLHAALPGMVRRDELVLGNRSRVSPGYWVATLGHYVGNFEAPLWGIRPSGKLVFLRCGEFYRLDEFGRVAEAFVMPDLLDLLRQTGRMPLPQMLGTEMLGTQMLGTQMLGTEMLFPGPATHDGVLPSQPERSDSSAALVEAMLTDLRSYDPATFQSAGQTGEGGYWHPSMLWFGPGGVGANFTYAGFDRDHRVPFLTAFPDRVGGNHFARFGDGDYVCSGGWPSMTMTHKGAYLGVPATGKALTLRVMDFWRVQHGTIRENWVLLDLVEMFDTLGVDLIARAAAL